MNALTIAGSDPSSGCFAGIQRDLQVFGNTLYYHFVPDMIPEYAYIFGVIAYARGTIRL